MAYSAHRGWTLEVAKGRNFKLLCLDQERETEVFGNASRSSGLAKTVLQGTVKGKQEMVQYVTNAPEGPLNWL